MTPLAQFLMQGGDGSNMTSHAAVAAANYWQPPLPAQRSGCMPGHGSWACYASGVPPHSSMEQQAHWQAHQQHMQQQGRGASCLPPQCALQPQYPHYSQQHAPQPQPQQQHYPLPHNPYQQQGGEGAGSMGGGEGAGGCSAGMGMNRVPASFGGSSQAQPMVEMPLSRFLG